ncbi:fumarylacetoacetate hydrolase family protein [Novosphingobium sp. MD-1]|uniref:fumarylacetoacetate hydrolase family protein n=1 Tax=Novosphingobium sp. MD-1 TaxID=1630648 RepID=UPI00061BA45E|nr:fumarylacetoacetate hydrolase family protein [Novosphingobium sp. MD-1]GAO52938.1 fumarylacetoacetate hydrolase family protein [Novosphingobium sp. MD-1]
MKLLRYSEGGKVHLGALEGETIIDLSPIESDYPTMLSIVAGGDAALARIRDTIAAREHTRPSAGTQLLAPMERPGKFLAIGMNYRKHIAESEQLGVPKPQQQYWFNKQTSCIAGPFDDIVKGVTEKLDYEVELGAIIGAPAKGVGENDARRHVFGYLICNDVSARDWQFHSPTFTMGKSFDTHGPIGPWIVTADEIDDPHNLALRCFVNGKLRQENNTSEMVFNLWQQIAYLSTAFTLESGDLIATGTPEGVGVAMNPPSFLQPGDVVRCEVDGIGAIENRVVA